MLVTSINFNFLLAKWTLRFAFGLTDPLSDAVFVKNVTIVAFELKDFIVFLEVVQADDASCVCIDGQVHVGYRSHVVHNV